MEFVGQPSPSGVYNLLGVPGLSSLDVDDDEGEVVIGIRPKSSPLPRRRSSATDDDSEPEPPLSGSRRVSFADAKGLSLVQVKEFDARDIPKLPGFDSSEDEVKEAEEYVLSNLTFSLPLPTDELFSKVRDQKLELETLELLPRTTILKGVIRVLNISFGKAVYIRTTLDTWSTHFDILAEYIPGSSDGVTDCFSFKLTLVPPFGEQGARVEFCVRYETPVGTFWANNDGRNYVLCCHHRMKEEKERPQRKTVNKKSCLKTASQDYSTVENISAKEASSQDNISTDVTRHGVEVGTITTTTISNGQLGTSEKHEQKVLVENRHNSNQKSRRKAARMARVRDCFAQRNGGANGAERDESPPEIKQAAQEETPKEKHTYMQSLSGRNNKPNGSQLVSESFETCSKPILHDMSPAHDYISNSESVKSESVTLADSATLTSSKNASDNPDNPVNSHDPAPAEQQNINKFVTKAEESSQTQDRSYECTTDTAPVSNKSLVSQTSCITFGTVVAPLYQQVFGRVGSESQGVSDWGNPVWATLNVGDLNPPTERRQNSCTDPTDVGSNNSKVEGNQTTTHKCVGTILNNPAEEEEKTSLCAMINDVQDCADTLQNPTGIGNSDLTCTNTSLTPKQLLGDTLGLPKTGNILDKDLLNSQIPPESLRLQRERLEVEQTHDLQSQTTAEKPECQLQEHMCTQLKSNQDEAQEVRLSLQSSITPFQPPQSLSGRAIEETGQHTNSRGENNNECAELNKPTDSGSIVIVSKTDESLKEDKLLEVLNDLSSNNISNSATKETKKDLVSCCEVVEETDFTTPETSLEAQGQTNNMEEGNEETHSSYEDKDKTKHSCEMKVNDEAAESKTKAMMSKEDKDGEIMFVGLKEEDSLEETEHCEMKATVSKQYEDFSLAGITEEKNWEEMVEEEENNILLSEEEEAKEEHVEEKKNKEIKEFLEEITVVREKGDTPDEAVGLEDREWIGEEEIWEADKESEDLNVNVTSTAKTAGEEKLVEEEKTEGPEERETHFSETEEVVLEAANVQEEEKIEGEEEMEMDLNEKGEASVEWEDQVKPKEENREQVSPDYKEEILVDETAEAEIIDADSCIGIRDREHEVERFTESLDITQKKAEDGLSALVDNEQEGVNERVNTENTGEGQNAHIQMEMCLYKKEEDFQNNANVAPDGSKAEDESTAAEGDVCILTDEPEIDQTSNGSTSAESDSDDEVELYMHCLRAVSTGAQAHKNRNSDIGFTVSKRPSVSRSKLLSTPMPSISESLDEEQQLSCLQESIEDLETAAITALTASSGQESVNQNVSGWKDTFSCSNISKTLLYTTLLVVFLVVAYHYDFLACFGLYLISVVWLCCQGERQPAKNNNRID